MEKYKNLGGDSGIYMFETGVDFIKVQFSNGKQYLYTLSSAGQCHIENMCRLARKGEGLNEYINKNVRNLYDR